MDQDICIHSPPPLWEACLGSQMTPQSSLSIIFFPSHHPKICKSHCSNSSDQTLQSSLTSQYLYSLSSQQIYLTLPSKYVSIYHISSSDDYQPTRTVAITSQLLVSILLCPTFPANPNTGSLQQNESQKRSLYSKSSGTTCVIQNKRWSLFSGLSLLGSPWSHPLLLCFFSSHLSHPGLLAFPRLH